AVLDDDRYRERIRQGYFEIVAGCIGGRRPREGRDERNVDRRGRGREQSECAREYRRKRRGASTGPAGWNEAAEKDCAGYSGPLNHSSLPEGSSIVYLRQLGEAKTCRRGAGGAGMGFGTVSEHSSADQTSRRLLV